MDNRLFNVNGRTFEQFELTLQLLLTGEYNNSNIKKFTIGDWGPIGSRVKGYKFDYKKGLILYWYMDKDIKPIDEIIPDFNEISITPPTQLKLDKSLRKYKLALLDNEINKRVTIPFDILVHSLWYWFKNFNDWDKLQFENWEYNADHDGSNEQGFRIYTESWGKISDEWYSIGAIKPVYLWYGK